MRGDSAAIAALNSQVAELRTDSRNFWMIWAGILVFSMQVSLAALAGPPLSTSVRLLDHV